MSFNGRKNRILMVGPAPEVMGGISAVVQSYFASNLVERVELKYLSTHVDGKKLKKLLVALKAYIIFPFLCLSFRPDLVHIHFSDDASFYRKAVILLLAKLFRRKAIGHCHGADFAVFHDSSRIHGFFIRRFLNALDAILVLSKSWRQLFETYTDNRKIVILYNPVNCAIFQDSRPWEHGTLDKMVLFMGRLGQRKGTYDIITAIPAIIAAFPTTKFVFAGDGEVEKADEMAKKMGVRDNVLFPGWTSGADKNRYFMDADLFLLPSYNEGLPVSILEAMAAGLPIISTPIGGIPVAVEEGVNGYLVTPGDSEAIARKTIQLLGNLSLRKEMGLANKKKVMETFDIDRIVDQLLKVYGSIPR